MPRPSLLAAMDEAMRHRLTMVTAGPGGGKTTLLASWARGHQCAWYDVSPEDTAPSVFAQGLVTALRVVLPAMPVTLNAQACAVAGRGGADAFAAVLADVLDRNCPTDLALVVDDLQELGCGASGRLLESLCRLTPPTVHLVLSSRSRPPFSVERLRGRGQVLDLEGGSLALGVGEIEALLAGVLGAGDTAPLAQQVHHITDGWPAATTLAAEWLRHHEPGRRPAVLTMLCRPGGPLFGYLAEEAFVPDDPPLGALLRQVAPVGCFTAELCRALGADVDETELARLARGGVFVVRCPGRQGWFRLGRSVREFAVTRMPLRTRDRVLRLAASWLIDNGHGADALACAVELGEPAAFLAEHGQTLLDQGHINEVLATSSALPLGERSDTIEQLEGRARLERGDLPGALACLRRAAAYGTELTDGLAWRLCCVHYARGEFDEAMALVSLPGDRTTADAAVLLAWCAAASWRRGDPDCCRRLAERAMTAATAIADDRAAAAAHAAMLLVCSGDGDRCGVDAHATQGLAAARRAGDVLWRALILTRVAAEQLDRGRYAELLDELAGPLGQVESWAPLGRYYLGSARRRLGRLAEATVDFEAAKAACHRIGSRDVAFPLFGLAAVHEDRGDLERARSAYAESVAWAERLGDPRALVPALAGLARVVVAENPERATRLAERAVECGRGGERVGALLAAGWVATARGEQQRADRLAIEAAEHAELRCYPWALTEALQLRAAVAKARTVQVTTLGGFGIVRDGRPVRAAEWNSKKARDLLKLLICKRGRPVPREVLIAMLWPEEEPARCANRLSVALSTVRSMLDPQHLHEPDHFVRSDKHLVALAGLRIDVEEFLAAASRVTARFHDLDELSAAEALYTGDFLEEDVYEDWAVSLREQARAAYLTVARTLARVAGDAGEYDLAVRTCLRVLERDPYDEEIHLGLISVLIAEGSHGRARAGYGSYTRRMVEIGVVPAPFPGQRVPVAGPGCGQPGSSNSPASTWSCTSLPSRK